MLNKLLQIVELVVLLREAAVVVHDLQQRIAALVDQIVKEKLVESVDCFEHSLEMFLHVRQSRVLLKGFVNVVGVLVHAVVGIPQ